MELPPLSSQFSSEWLQARSPLQRRALARATLKRKLYFPPDETLNVVSRRLCDPREASLSTRWEGRRRHDAVHDESPGHDFISRWSRRIGAGNPYLSIYSPLVWGFLSEPLDGYVCPLVYLVVCLAYGSVPSPRMRERWSRNDPGFPVTRGDARG